MNIEQMSTRLRQRSSWEAVDLGFSLARRWFLPLWLLWLVPAAVVMAVMMALFESNLVALLITWWLQPLYERPLLHFLSRALFSEYPPLKTVYKSYWSIIKPQLLPLILWRRCNPGRTFVDPVALLEGLKGKPRGRRLSVLGIGLNGTAVWFGILCWLFGAVLDLSQIALLYLVIPNELNLSILDVLFDSEQALHWLGCWIWLLSASVIAPFYVGGGFALYISRRTQLEGWDIELAFRKLSSRLLSFKQSSTLTALLLTIGLTATALTPNNAVALEPEVAKTQIEEITNHPDFGELKTRKVWRAIEADEPAKDRSSWNEFWEKFGDWFSWLSDAMPMVGFFFKVILILAAIWLIVWLLMRYTSWLDWLPRPGSRRGRKKRRAPTSLFGLELNAESLPDDVASEALALLDAGHIRDALSLLFRASLSHLVHHSELPIGDSSTERECLRLVESHRPSAEVDYFRRLTDTWLLLAYAHQPPGADHTRALCVDWRAHYSEATEQDAGAIS